MKARNLSLTIGNIVPERTLKALQSAESQSAVWLQKAKRAADNYIKLKQLPAKRIVVAALGSVGRREALHASDFDVMPVTDGEVLDADADAGLRKAISTALGVKVSKGEDLTKRTTLQELSNPELIGTDEDSTSRLSQRIMALTESAAAGGSLSLETVRSKILRTYASENRTSGRHVHSFCNDIARYYRTLCIEYKAKVDVQSKDWGTRNMKLRHSRKVWYFSSILACASTADQRDASIERVLGELGKPPADRIVDAVRDRCPRALPLAGLVLESYAFFLEFMAVKKHRTALSKINHEDRYEANLRNPFPMLKFNSDLLHTRMIALLDALDSAFRERVLAWFLF